MIKVRVEVRNETGRFTVAVHAETLQHATRIARDLHPGSAVGIAFPIEPDGFFGGAPTATDASISGTLERPGKRRSL